MTEWEWQLLEDKTPVEAVSILGANVRSGDRVILRPRRGGDIFDLALAGQIALVESIEQDYEGKLHLAVVVEDDPGRDLGILRQPGHRFFFTPEEVEPCPALPDSATLSAPAGPKILVAGIGNIFLGDDGFGVEVVRRLAAREFPANVRIRDFGIRGYDLTYALLDSYDAAILIDACPHGKPPGTVSLIEPDLAAVSSAPAPLTLDAHTMNPLNVLRLAREMGAVPPRIWLVACEPATFGGEEGEMALSPAVEAAVDAAVRTVERLIRPGQP
jgi:hydrogenase maturation protease